MGLPSPSERNRRSFDDAGVVADYASLQALTPAEEHLLGRRVPAGSEILDLGVGTGRTTRHLCGPAARYVGIDISDAMVATARELLPGVDLRVGDAADLGEFATGSFDVVVFSYNGLDYLHPDRVRHRCLDEVGRVLRPGGSFIFSAHDPRAVLRHPQPGAGPKGVAVAGYQSARRVIAQVPTAAFWRGAGYVVDPVRGGLVTRMSRPDVVVDEVTAHGFRHLETVPGDHPRAGTRWSTPWWYYAFERT